MKVIHVSDCFLPGMGGIETQVSGLAGQQAKLGWQIEVLTCQSRNSFDDTSLPYRVRRSVWANPAQAPIDPRAPRRFFEEILRFSPDVVHLHLGELTPVVEILLPRLARANIPTVVTVHSVWNRHITVPLFRAFTQVSGLAKSGVLWTGVSQLVADRIGAAVGPKNVRLLSNGVDAWQWQVSPVVHSGLVAVTAARFAPRKRLPELLEILRKVSGQEPSLRAVLAGDGPGMGQARRFVAEHGLEEVIELPGRQNSAELKEIYAGADVFLSPSVAEAASIAAGEAQAAGLAILSRAQSGLGERISDAEGATAKTDEDFAQILQEWAANPVLVEPIKQHNRDNLCPLDWSRVLPQAERRYLLAIERVTHLASK